MSEHLNATTGERHTVLIVEDAALSREMLVSFLEDIYDVIDVETGQEALSAIESNKDHLSVILLDLMLPDIHGLEILHHIRENHDTSSIPVIVLTSDKEAEVNSLDAGAVDFIPKPYPSPEIIRARVRRTIEISENNMLDDIQNISSSSVAEALSSDYFAIYYVNAENDRFIEYSASEEYRRFGIETSGEEFFDLSRKNIIHIIHPDDKDLFLDGFTKEKVLVALYMHPTFTMTYRLLLGGTPTYVHMKISRMRDRDDSHIVVGISNIDEQMKAKEAYERAHQDSVTFSRIAQALAEDYFSIYYVNVWDDSFIEYSSDESYRKLNIEKSGNDFFNLSRKNTMRVMYPEDQGAFLAAFTKENILNVLSEHRSFTLTYRLMLDGKPTWVSMKATRMNDTHGEHIIIGIYNIDAQMRQKEEYQKSEEERITYARIAQALAGDYFSIYVVDPETKHFLEYSATEEYDALGFEKGGEDFFNLSRANIERAIYPEDYGMFLEQFTEERLIDEMARRGIFTLKYRLMFDGQPAWVSMKATLMEDDHGSHIVIGINNIDAQIRREQEYNYKLSVAREKANRDPLTGVKSKHAFLDKEEQLNHAITEGKARGFAVIVCDVNGLKEVNDTQGHNAGDLLIKEAAMVICRTFKHSPVFRTGGDEFVVISEGQDFDNLDTLVEEFRLRNERSRSEGDVVIACGASTFDGDESFSAVFDRADTAMYENKSALKA